MRAQGVGWATLSPLTRKEAAHVLGPKSNLCLEARPPPQHAPTRPRGAQAGCPQVGTAGAPPPPRRPGLSLQAPGDLTQVPRAGESAQDLPGQWVPLEESATREPGPSPQLRALPGILG